MPIPFRTPSLFLRIGGLCLATALLAGCSEGAKPVVDMNDKPVVDMPGNEPPAPKTEQVKITKPAK